MQPKQYTQGWVEFYKLKFIVTPDVLIPRPETELLVDEVLKFVKDCHVANTPRNDIVILDIGTGAGAIAISIAKNLKGHPWGGTTNIIATDISPEALEIAKQNAKFHGVEDKIQFMLSDLLESVILSVSEGYKLDSSPSVQNDNLVIVTNLPYIPSERIPYLDESVKDFEPHVALDGGEDGFELYRKLFQQIKDLNWKPKLLLGEIDYTHGELAANEAYNYFPGAEIEVKKDLSHMQRILYIKN